jgi:hypothetical protein
MALRADDHHCHPPGIIAMAAFAPDRSRTADGLILFPCTNKWRVRGNHAMKTFEECQALATKVPPSLRNNRARIDLSVPGLQEEAGKIGSLLGKEFASGKLGLTQVQSGEVKDRLSDVL